MFWAAFKIDGVEEKKYLSDISGFGPYCSIFEEYGPFWTLTVLMIQKWSRPVHNLPKQSKMVVMVQNLNFQKGTFFWDALYESSAKEVNEPTNNQ